MKFAVDAGDAAMLRWLSERKVELSSESARFATWKDLMRSYHPDTCTSPPITAAERLGTAARCNLLREAKAWFVHG